MPVARRNLAAEHFETILALVGTGLSIAKACAQTPCSRGGFMQYLGRNPDKAELIRVAQCQPPVGADLARLKADEILTAIAAGKSATEVCKALGVNVRQFTALCRTDAALRKRYVAAQRKRGGKAISAKPPRRWNADDFDRALDFIAAYRKPGIERAMPDSVPSIASCYRRATWDESFAKRFTEVMRRHVAATLPMRFVATPDVSLLHQALLQNEIYAAGWKRFKGFDKGVRDDLISIFVLSVLDGTRSLEALASQKHRRDIVRDVAGADRALTSLSVKQFFGEDRVELVDTIGSENGIHFY